MHGDWDDASGFASAREAWEVRRAEDLEACARSGARSVHLDELDRQHVDGDGGGIDGERLRARVADLLAADELLWLPSAIGRHRDHGAVRDALLPLLAAHPGGGVIYADSPYAGQAGWEVDDAERPPAARWEPELAAIREHVALSERRDVRLDGQASAPSSSSCAATARSSGRSPRPTRSSCGAAASSRRKSGGEVPAP